MECVIELESPGLLHVFVLNAINHSLEKSSQAREFVGKLLDLLIKQKQIPFDKFLQGSAKFIQKYVSIDFHDFKAFIAHSLCYV